MMMMFQLVFPIFCTGGRDQSRKFGTGPDPESQLILKFSPQKNRNRKYNNQNRAIHFPILLGQNEVFERASRRSVPSQVAAFSGIIVPLLISLCRFTFSALPRRRFINTKDKSRNSILIIE